MSKEKYTVMIAEDDEDDYALAKDALKEGCPDVTQIWAKDGEEALDYLLDESKTAPSVIFLDLNMPKIDGWQCLTRIRSSEKLKHIPVVVLTNSATPADIMKAYQLGANNYVRKP